MIVAQRKSFEQIAEMLAPFERVLLVGCGTCVAVCMAGGEKEVELLAAELRMHAKKQGKALVVDEVTVTRQCDKEYLEPLAKYIDHYQAVLSLACGAGVQFLAERYEDKLVLPGLDTRFIGVAQAPGVWEQRCVACSECVLDQTGGVCPMTRCAKNLLNGPCGGTNHGKCEVDGQKDCAWTLIYRKLEKLGRLDLMRKIHPPKDYSVATNPGLYVHPAFDESRQKSGGD